MPSEIDQDAFRRTMNLESTEYLRRIVEYRSPDWSNEQLEIVREILALRDALASEPTGETELRLQADPALEPDPQTARRIAQFTDRLSSPKASERYEACENLRVSPVLPLSAISALEATLADPDPSVADAAKRALTLHRQATPKLMQSRRGQSAELAQTVSPTEKPSAHPSQAMAPDSRLSNATIDALSDLESERPVIRYLAVQKLAENRPYSREVVRALLLHSEDPDADVANASRKLLADHFAGTPEPNAHAAKLPPAAIAPSSAPTLDCTEGLPAHTGRTARPEQTIAGQYEPSIAGLGAPTLPSASPERSWIKPFVTYGTLMGLPIPLLGWLWLGLGIWATRKVGWGKGFLGIAILLGSAFAVRAVIGVVVLVFTGGE